jgi:3-methyl-2-oxobutanoate hydroxymethyltransferase
MAKATDPNAMPLAAGRTTVWHLQKMKDEGIPITMVGVAYCDPFWVTACERAGVNLVRYTANGESSEQREFNMYTMTRLYRKAAPNICLNAVMQTSSHASKERAVEVAGRLLSDGADSVQGMAITNECLKYMSDNFIPVFGHVGCLSGWQTGRFGGYKRVGKTAQEAMDVFQMAYGYQENGMVGMTIEMSSREVTNAIAKKLRVPVIQVAAGGAADGSELVIFDLLGFQPVSTMPKHAKHYRSYFEDGIQAFKEFDADVKSHAYPAEEHGWSMDPQECEKFLNLLEKHPAKK